MPLFYHLVIYPLAVGLGKFVRLWVRWEVKGSENVPKKGKLIVVCNHMNASDILLLAVNLGRKGTFMAKEELFKNPVQACFFNNVGSFPIHRENALMDLTGMRKAYDILARDGALLMFPEGTRSRNGGLKPALSGAVAIAQRSGAPILPVGITGSEKVRGIFTLFRPPHIVIKFGEPYYVPEASRTKEARAELTQMMMSRLAELLPESYRGVYSTEKVANES